MRPISFPLARAPPAPPVRSRTVANDPRIAAARKPDGIDFVGNSKISSFPQNPHPTAPHGIFIPWHRAAFRRAASNSRMARLERRNALRLLRPTGCRRCPTSIGTAIPARCRDFRPTEIGIFVSQTAISPSEQGISSERLHRPDVPSAIWHQPVLRIGTPSNIGLFLYDIPSL